MEATHSKYNRVKSFFKKVSPTFITLGVIAAIIALIIIFKGIFLQLLGLLLLLVVIIIGFIYLWRFIFGLLALAAIIAGVFMAFGILFHLFSFL